MTCFSQRINNNNINASISYKRNVLNRLISGKIRAQKRYSFKLTFLSFLALLDLFPVKMGEMSMRIMFLVPGISHAKTFIIRYLFRILKTGPFGRQVKKWSSFSNGSRIILRNN